jgi:hypothetical protein
MTPTTDLIVLFRIAERLTLTLVVLIVAAIVMIGFWRTVQRVDLTEGGKLGVAGSFAFSTPVFVLLTIVGYAYVSLSAPITVTPAAAGQAMQLAGGSAPGFIGVMPVPPGADTAPDGDPDHARAVADRKIRSLNCLAQGREMTARQEDDLALVKLGLMAPVWAADWGAQDAFRAWATGIDPADPNPQARATFNAVHPVC